MRYILCALGALAFAGGCTYTSTTPPGSSSSSGGSSSGSSSGGSGSGGSSSGAPSSGGSASGGSSSGAVSAATLDGTWKTTHAPTQLFGADLAQGTITAAGGQYVATFTYADVGSAPAAGCKIVTHQSVTTISINGKAGSGSIVESQTATADCTNPDSTFTRPISTFTLAQTTPRTPTSTPYDGDWTLTFTSPHSGSAIISVDGLSWKVANSGSASEVVASGTIANGVATGTDGTNDFAAQKQ